MTTWILATQNPHKLTEAQQIVGSAVRLLPLPPGLPAAEEHEPTLYGNALAKARFYRPYVAYPVLAEDSGLFVPALGGKPGVQSARYGGPERLLQELPPEAELYAYFAAVVVAYFSEETYYFFHGLWEGRLSRERRGTEGFGYDPIFIPAKEQRTVAELGQAWKVQHSHRAQALRKWLVWLSSQNQVGL
ncbi:MAG: non-canonical purine NTP pyrophosphatase [Bacteroidia bacterium]|nr:non-canonical purine NTP pyrophosphatase [Bacteroidia bacterium]MDW8089498.1 non-canonical purine NTP pyrophosphatase [Bacteroidia bacterium]